MIGIRKRLSLSISPGSLLTICKSFVHPHLDYADIIYDKPGNVNFESKLERVQYNIIRKRTIIGPSVLSQGPIRTVYMQN